IVTRVFDFSQFEDGLLSSVTLARANGDKIHGDTYDYGDLEKGGTLNVETIATTEYQANGDPLYTVNRAYTHDSAGRVTDIKATTTEDADVWVREITQDPIEGGTRLPAPPAARDWCFRGRSPTR